jgi:hypothetical protein
MNTSVCIFIFMHMREFMRDGLDVLLSCYCCYADLFG